MGKGSVVSGPVHRAMVRDWAGLPTCGGWAESSHGLVVCACGHADGVRLHPPVVRFLSEVLAELPAPQHRQHPDPDQPVHPRLINTQKPGDLRDSTQHRRTGSNSGMYRCCPLLDGAARRFGSRRHQVRRHHDTTAMSPRA